MGCTMPLIWIRTSKGQKGYTHAMNRISPSQKGHKKTEDLGNQGLDGDVNLPLDIGNTGVHEESRQIRA
jgi:hypothetical protein